MKDPLNKEISAPAMSVEAVLQSIDNDDLKTFIALSEAKNNRLGMAVSSDHPAHMKLDYTELRDMIVQTVIFASTLGPLDGALLLGRMTEGLRESIQKINQNGER